MKPFSIPLNILTVLLCIIATTAFAQPGKKIMPGDRVYLEVYRVPELTQTLQVGQRGEIVIPYAGTVKISGMTEADAAAQIAQGLKKILKNPRVTVTKSDYMPSTFTPQSNGQIPRVEMVLEIIPLLNADAESMYNVMLGMSSTGGNVSFDPATNTLIITDTPSAVANMKDAITQLDQMQSQLTQVKIETKIVEVRVGAMKELGIRWFAQGDHLSGGFTPTQRQTPKANSVRGGLSPSANEANAGGGNSGGGDQGGGGGRTFLEDPPTRRLNIPLQAALPGQIFLGYMNSGIDVGAMLDMLVSEDEADMLANPVTLAVNHQPAHIEMVDRIPYSEYGVEITGATTFSTKFLDAGIKLDVTPHVFEDANGPYVKLELKPEVSFPSGTNNGIPILSVRRSETVANVRDGQTLVVGGILSEDQREVVAKLPWIGDLPIIGLLFKHKETTRDRTELMIFVTPTIYENPEDITWDKMISSSFIDSDPEDVPEELEEKKSWRERRKERRKKEEN